MISNRSNTTKNNNNNDIKRVNMTIFKSRRDAAGVTIQGYQTTFKPNLRAQMLIVGNYGKSGTGGS